MKLYLQTLRKYKALWQLVILQVILLLGAATTALEPKIFSKMLPAIGTARIWKLVAIYIAISLLDQIFVRMGWFVQSFIYSRVLTRYHNDLHEAVINASISELNRFPISTLTTGASCAPQVVDTIVRGFSNITRLMSTSLMAFVVLWNESWQLTLLVIATTLPFFITVAPFQRYMKKCSKEIHNNMSRLNERINRLACYRLIKDFRKEESEKRYFRGVTDDIEKVFLRKKTTTTCYCSVAGITWSVSVVALVVYLTSHFDGNLTRTIELGIVFYGLLEKMVYPISDVPDMVSEFTEALEHLRQNQEILDLGEEYDGTIDLEGFHNQIEFRNVSFKYRDSTTVLKNVDLTIPKGTHVGIYGPSGGGKSTFVNLLKRYFNVEDGEILIDGININSLTKKSLRKVICSMSQDVQIFSDINIRDNIAYGGNYPESEIIRAAKKANAHEFISKLEKSYDSLVGNNGVLLSGGERQRIALARLFLMDPEILILDEATSALDNESEKIVQDAIDRLGKGKTVITIAHRLSTIEHSDMLVGIDDHQVIEYGPAAEIKKYARLWNRLKK